MTFILVGACDSPTGEDVAHSDVRGIWTYTATQTAPALNIEGVLDITEQTGTFFSGTATLTEIDVQGTRRQRAGALSGSFVGGTVLDFDIHIDAQTRRHVGRIDADSVSGTWSATASIPLNGEFEARRQ